MYMYIHAYTYACQREHTCLLFAGMLASRHAHLCMHVKTETQRSVFLVLKEPTRD